MAPSVVSAAINRYIFIAINRTFTNDYFLKYSALERVDSIEEIEHPIVREAFLRHPVGAGIEMVSGTDIHGLELGSDRRVPSRSVCLRALYAFRREHVSASTLAAEACEIEIECLGRPVGKQDQYIAAFGGLSCMEFECNGRVDVSPLSVSNETLPRARRPTAHVLHRLFAGRRRRTQGAEDPSEGNDAEMVDNLHQDSRSWDSK